MDQLAASFGVQDAIAVKKACPSCAFISCFKLQKHVFCDRHLVSESFWLQVESVTNHDVKAIEYVIKDRIGHNPELAKVHTAAGMVTS